jgi:hypothetical protein
MQLAFPVYRVMVIVLEALGAVYPVLLLVLLNTKKANAYVQTL